MMAGGEEFKRCLVDRTDRTTLLIGRADKRILQKVREKQGNIYIYIYTHMCMYIYIGFPGVLVVKNPPASAGDIRHVGLIPGVGEIPWRRAL